MKKVKDKTPPLNVSGGSIPLDKDTQPSTPGEPTPQKTEGIVEATQKGPDNISCEEPADAPPRDNNETPPLGLGGSIPLDNVTIKKAEYEELKKKAAEAGINYDRWLRQQAEFDNFRKRVNNEKEEFRRYAQEGLIFELLNSLDDFERALSAVKKSEDFKVLFNGVEMMAKRLDEVLRKKGLTRMEPVGTKFNPEMHEAIAEVVSEEHPEHTVVEELQKGYIFHGRVLRPARVKVSKKPEKKQEEQTEHEKNESEGGSK